MKSFLAVTAGVAASHAFVHSTADKNELMSEYDNYLLSFGKSYSEEEKPARFERWLQSLREMEEVQKDIPEFVTAYTHFFDLFDDEQVFTPIPDDNLLTNTPKKNEWRPSEPAVDFNPRVHTKYPSSVDFRRRNCVTAAKQQGTCGSCWAFTMAATVETNWCLATKKLTALSEQMILDCSNNGGCNGGSTLMGYFKYNGICPESSYKYRGKQGSCNSKACSLNDMAGWEETGQTWHRSPLQLVEAINRWGSMAGSVSFEGYKRVLKTYGGQILTKEICDKAASGNVRTDHAVTVVGYEINPANGRLVLLIKNSWGRGWGNDGFAKIEYESCGLKHFNFPIIEDVAAVREILKKRYSLSASMDADAEELEVRMKVKPGWNICSVPPSLQSSLWMGGAYKGYALPTPQLMLYSIEELQAEISA